MFAAFFLVLYSLVTYGMIFSAQQSLNLAAQDGARRALQWQGGAAHMQLRAEAARSLAVRQADWVSSVSGTPVAVAVCGKSGPLSVTGSAACSGLPLADDQIEVNVSYPYGAYPLVPTLPLFGYAIVPDTLTARASVRLSDLGGSGA